MSPQTTIAVKTAVFRDPSNHRIIVATADGFVDVEQVAAVLSFQTLCPEMKDASGPTKGQQKAIEPGTYSALVLNSGYVVTVLGSQNSLRKQIQEKLTEARGHRAPVSQEESNGQSSTSGQSD
jgi:hypothetical protein